ncbi:MAG: hypothetical protein CSB06_03575 [Bacteroidia bacterium]|nr:MAG: hypothetical protein CSB06_03575 [Bacteroidia bacterium]
MRKNLLLLLFIGFNHFLFSQELLFHLGSGFAGHIYRSDFVKNNTLFGGDVGVSYTHYFLDNLGLNAGLELGLYRNKLKLENEYSYVGDRTDDTDENFEYRLTTKGYVLRNHSTALVVPLLLQYRAGKKRNIYVNGGVKFVIPQKLKGNAEAKEIHISGYYPDENLLIDDLPQHGFGSITNWSGDEKMKQRFTVTVSLETGMYFHIKRASGFYAGLYVDYGLTDMFKNTDAEKTGKETFIEYSPAGIDKSKCNGMQGLGIEKANLLAFGLRIKYALNLNRL